MGLNMRLNSGPLWALAGFIVGATLTAAVAGRYQQLGRSGADFMLLDHFTGKLYRCLVDQCEPMPVKDEP
jgi:hypothetical protein